MKILLIWETVPTELSVYYEDVTEMTLKDLRVCQGHYINEIDFDDQIEGTLMNINNWRVEELIPVYRSGDKKRTMMNLSTEDECEVFVMGTVE